MKRKQNIKEKGRLRRIARKIHGPWTVSCCHDFCVGWSPFYIKSLQNIHTVVADLNTKTDKKVNERIN